MRYAQLITDYHTGPAEEVAPKVARYLPSNYEVMINPKGLLILGEDVAGWSLSGYVLPRLASGMYYAREITPNDVGLLL